MIKSQAGAGEQHAWATELLGKEAIVNPLAVGCITDDGVSNVLEMAPNLMAPPGYWFRFNQCISATRLAVDRNR